MNVKTGNTKNRDMHEDRTKYANLSRIYRPGMHENCRELPMGNPQQSQVQQSEQIVRSGKFRSRIPEQAPVKEEAG